MLSILSHLWSAVQDNSTLVLISLGVVILTVLLLFLIERYVTAKKTERKVSKIKYMTVVALLSAISGILMVFEFPLPFLAPPFYKIDLSEVPVVVGAFALGPVAGVVIEFIKIIINLFVNGTTSAFIGEIANFIIGISFVLPAAFLYSIGKTKSKALQGLIFGTIFTTITGVLLNAYVLLPFYAAAFGGMDKIIAAGTAVNPSINSVLTFCLLAVAPFNLLKFVVVSVITMSLYHSLKKVVE